MPQQQEGDGDSLYCCCSYRGADLLEEEFPTISVVPLCILQILSVVHDRNDEVYRP